MNVLKSPGGYRFLPVDGPFSAGVAAEPGYRIVRIHAPRYTPLEQGFRLVEQTLQAAGRPLTSLCAMELRIPRPVTRDGFAEFNKGYVAQHERWGLRIDGHLSPARTNVAPEIEPPPGPSLHAFCHTVEGQGGPTFVISGAPEPPGTEGGRPAYWAAMGDIMEERMSALGVGWADATETQFYGTRADHEVFASAELGHFAELVRPGLSWYFSRPPVEDLKLEIDVRALAQETWV